MRLAALRSHDVVRRKEDVMPGTRTGRQPAPALWESLAKLAFLGVMLVTLWRSGGYDARKAFLISCLVGFGLLLGLQYAGLRWGGRWTLIGRVFMALWCIAYGIGGAFLTYAAQKRAPDDVERSVIPWLICLAGIALGLHGLIKTIPWKAPRSADADETPTPQ